MNWTTLFSTVAALTAAVLSGLNLYLTGRREQQRWLREQLLEHLHSVLATSFVQTRTAQRLRKLRSGLSSPPTQEQEQLADAIDQAHADQMDSLTHLRLLAPEGVIKAVRDLHAAAHVVVDCCRDETSTQDQVTEALKACFEQRVTFLAEARRCVQVPGAVSRVFDLP